MICQLMSVQLLRGLLAALLLTAAMTWPLSADLDAREVDIEHKVVPQSEIKDSPLRLVGTAVTGDPSQRLAVIEDMKKLRQWSFHEGDHAGSILIKEIRRDHIVIDAGKGEETVRLKSFLIMFAEPSVKETSGPSVTQINRFGSRKRQRVVDHAVIETAFADPEAALNKVKILPARFFNTNMGFRISGFGSDNILSEMGLRSGDLLLAINDHEITGPQEAATFLETIRQGGSIDLTVRRRARTYHINLLIQ